MISLGRHLLAEFYNCESGVLNDPEQIERLMNEAARLSGATVVQSVFHVFSPHGVSGVVVVEESHLAVHTWPEYGYAAVDYFSCGDVDCDAAVRYLAIISLPGLPRGDERGAARRHRGARGVIECAVRLERGRGSVALSLRNGEGGER